MGRVIEKSAESVEEAIHLALVELDVSEDQVLIEVVQEASSKGFLGIGKKDAVVRVSLDEEDADDPSSREFVYYGDDEEDDENAVAGVEDKAVEFVAEILSGIGIHGKLDSYHQGNTIFIDVSGQDCGYAIGRGGDTLDAISYLTTLVANKDKTERVHVHLDIGDYRRRRESVIVDRARKTASRVIRYGRSLALEPMKSSERRAIHFALQDFEGIRTHSEGDEPNRKIVISPRRESEEEFLGED